MSPHMILLQSSCAYPGYPPRKHQHIETLHRFTTSATEVTMVRSFCTCYPPFFLGENSTHKAPVFWGSLWLKTWPNGPRISATRLKMQKELYIYLAILLCVFLWDSDFTWPLKRWIVTSNWKIKRSQLESPAWEGKLDEHYDLFTPARMRYVTNRIIQCLVLLEEKLFIHFWTTVTKWARTSYKWRFKPWGPGLRNGENWGVLFTQWLKWNKGRILGGWAPI